MNDRRARDEIPGVELAQRADHIGEAQLTEAPVGLRADKEDEMQRTHQSGHSAFGSILSLGEGPKASLFVGRGDTFDDDRRLVRGSEPLPENVRYAKQAYAPRVPLDVR